MEDRGSCLRGVMVAIGRIASVTNKARGGECAS